MISLEDRISFYLSSLFAVGINVQDYVIWHNEEMRCYENCFLYRKWYLPLRRNKLIPSNEFVVLHKDVQVKTICGCCGQAAVITIDNLQYRSDKEGDG